MFTIRLVVRVRQYLPVSSCKDTLGGISYKLESTLTCCWFWMESQGVVGIHEPKMEPDKVRYRQLIASFGCTSVTSKDEFSHCFVTVGQKKVKHG